MSGTFQLAGTIGGSFFGPIGAAIGGTIGGLIDQEVFGKAQKGPRLNEFGSTGSAVGTPMMRAYGLNKLAGELIWFGRLREKKKTKKVGGIGGFGGQKVVTYTYFATFAIGLGEGEIKCLRRIKINGRVWWEDPGVSASTPQYLDQLARVLQFGADSLTPEELAEYNETTLTIATSQAKGDNFTFYRGTSDQPVDPTIQSYLGDFAPAYRDTAYVVFTELPVTEYGGALPLIEFEIVSGDTVPGTAQTIYVAQQMQPWAEGGRDPRNGLNQHEYRYGGIPGEWRDTLEAAIDDAETDLGYELDSTLIGWNKGADDGGTSQMYVSPYLTVSSEDSRQVFLHFNRYTGLVDEARYFGQLIKNASVCGSWAGNGIAPGDDYFYWTGLYDDGSNAGGKALPGVWQFSSASNGGGFPVYSPPLLAGVDSDPNFQDNCTSYPPIGGYFPAFKAIRDIQIEARRVLSCPSGTCNGEPLPENTDYCVDENGVITPLVTFAETTDGTFLQLALLEYSGSLPAATQYPVGPVLNLDVESGSSRNTEEFWGSVYASAVAAGAVPAGWAYQANGLGGSGTYPRVVETVCTANLADLDYCDASPVLVADIIEAECLKRGLTLNDIDTSLVADTIPGYMLPRNISGRDAIEQLRTYSWLDAAEIDGVLKFVPRGLDEVATLTLDDMGAHEYGGQRPAALEVTRVDDIQLPKEVRVSYIDVNAELGPGQQYDRRLITDAVNIQQIDLAIAMDGDRGKKIATIALYDQWAARKAMETGIGPSWLALTPTDCIWVPDGENYVRARIESIDDALPGLRRLTMVRDEQSLYDRDASGPTPQIPDSQPSPGQGPTTLLVLDLPPGAAGEYDDAGYEIAAYGVLDSWEGAEIFRSLDGGTTYESVLDSSAAIAGIVETPFDGSEMAVRVYGGELLSTTPSAAAAGTNRFAAGVNGRWVIGTFETATSLGDGRYALSDITYGLFDTLWAVTTGSPESFGQAGDAFVMLETVSRVSEGDSIVGQEIIFKAVTNGTSFDNAPTVTVIARGNGRDFVADFETDIPPTHSDGATVVVGQAPTGVFVGHEDEIAHSVDGEWVFEQPEDGRQVRAPDGSLYQYVAGSPGYWLLLPSSSATQESIASLDARVTALESGEFSFDPDTILTDGDSVLVGADGNVLISG